MKILVISPGFLPTIGGAEIGVHEIYYRLAARHQVLILTQATGQSSLHLPGYDLSRYQVVRYRDWLNLGRIPGRMLMHGAIPPFSVGATLAAMQTIRRFNPDVINVHYAIYTGLAAIWARQAAHIPTVLSLVGRDSAPGPQVPALWPWYAAQVADRVSHTIFISDFCRKYYRPQLPSTVIPYGVDPRAFRATAPDSDLTRQINLPSGAHVIFSLQRLAPVKRVDIQLQAARLLLDLGLRNFVFLVGGSGPEKQRLEDLAGHLGIRDQVRFLGYIPEPDLPRFLSLASLFVITSAYETFGIVLAQAMAAGLPIAALANTAIPEVVPHGICGLLSPESDLQSFAENIRHLLENQLLRQQMGSNARLRAEKLYDWEKIASQYEVTLEQACR